MDDVRKGVKVYAELMHKKVNMHYTEGENSDENGNISESDQTHINISLALTNAKIRPYNDEEFVAQIFVDTAEDKAVIDSIRKDLTQFIIKRSHYDHLKLEVMTDDPDSKTFVPYTPVDKYNFIKQNAPAIELLKENFKCEIKY